MSEAFEKAMAAREREKRRAGMFGKRGVLWWAVALFFGAIVYGVTLIVMQSAFG